MDGCVCGNESVSVVAIVDSEIVHKLPKQASKPPIQLYHAGNIIGYGIKCRR